MSTGTRPVAVREWPRKKFALLGIVLMIPFLAILAAWTLSGFWGTTGLAGVLIVLGIPAMLVGVAGGILLFVAWITPPGKRPLVDPVRLW